MSKGINPILMVVMEVRIFKNLFNALDMMNTINLTFGEDGIKGQTMDSSHVSLLDIFMDAGKMKKYQCVKNLTLGFNIGSVKKIMGCGGNKDRCGLYVNEGNEDVVHFVFETPGMETRKEFKLRLMEIEEEGLNIPEMDYSAMITFDSNVFKDMCKDLSSFGDAVTIRTYSGDGVVVFCSGTKEDNETAKFSYKLGSASGVEGEINEDGGFTYALTYMKSFTGATPLGNKVTLMIREDAPICVNYVIGDGMGHIKFFLAPKIDGDE